MIRAWRLEGDNLLSCLSGNERSLHYEEIKNRKGPYLKYGDDLKAELDDLKGQLADTMTVLGKQPALYNVLYTTLIYGISIPNWCD